MQPRKSVRAVAVFAPAMLAMLSASTPGTAAEPFAAGATEAHAPALEPGRAPATLPSASELMRGALAPDAIRSLIERRPQACSAAERCRRITFDTRELSYVNYLQAWRTRLGRASTGQVLAAKGNYPSAATTQLEIVMDVDGSVKDVVVTATSGSEVFDDAAMRSIRAAAPYPALPPDIHKDFDELRIDAHIRYTIGVGASLAHE